MNIPLRLSQIEDDIGHLSPVQKILLGTDGSVTQLLEAVIGKPIAIKTRLQEIIPVDPDTAKKLGITAGMPVNHRVVEIKNNDTGEVLIHAVSYTPVERLPDEFRNDLPKNVHYLRDSMIEIDGLKIYGTPWTPPFYDWAFMAEETELDRKFSGIPEGIDILLSHGPAYGLADAITERFDIGKNCGSHSLLKHVQRVMPTYFFSGHIHSADHRVNEYVYNNKVTKYANVSILDEYYEPAYFPLVYPPPQI